MPAQLQTQQAAVAAPPTLKEVAAAQLWARTRDPLGHQIHSALAILFLFLLPLATAPKDAAFIALAIWTCIRIPHTWRSYAPPVGSLMTVAVLTWLMWHLLSLTWSVDWRQGMDEFRALRMLALPLLLWPILDRVPWLIAAALAGVLVQNGFQALQALDWVNVRPNEGEGRFGGLMHPGRTGAWCVAAMCWHFSAVMRGRGWVRWLSASLFVISSAGLLATESRGAWLAAAVAIPSMLVVTMIRRPQHRRVVLIAGLVGLAGAAIAWPFFGSEITQRIEQTTKEIDRADRRGIYWTSVGARIGMAKWTWHMLKSHPLCGVGAGSYPKMQAADPEFQDALQRAPTENKREFMTKEHPHSTYFYALACTGAIGSLILLLVLALTLRQCWIDPPNHLYAEGTFFVLISWIVGAQFDCYNLDGHRIALLGVLISITVPLRAAIRLTLRATDNSNIPREART